MAIPFEKSLSSSSVEILIKVSLFVLISEPSVSDKFGRVFFCNFSNSLIVPKTPPEIITPFVVMVLVFLKKEVLFFRLITYPSEPSFLPKGLIVVTSCSASIFAPFFLS